MDSARLFGFQPLHLETSDYVRGLGQEFRGCMVYISLASLTVFGDSTVDGESRLLQGTEEKDSL